MITALVRAAAEVAPTPTPTVDPELVTPGPVGFTIMAVLVLLVAVLIWDMLRRVRRVRYRAEVREELDAEAASSTADRTADEGTDPVPDAGADSDESNPTR